MGRAPMVIHQYGRPTKATDVDGREIFREERIFFNRAWCAVLDYDNHFVYKTDKIGAATLMCTCGSAAGVVGYHAYKNYSSFIGNEVVACLHHLNSGRHGDGSS